MKCLIVDDQKAYHLILANLIKLNPVLDLVGSYLDPLEAHKVILDQEIDIIFLDIEMPGMNGIELARILEGKRPLIIFTTSQAEYAVTAFDLNVVDYLVKPIEPSRFLKAVEKARGILDNKSPVFTNESDAFLFIRDSYTIKRIKTDDILYLEANVNYVNIHMSSKMTYSIHTSISALEQKLPHKIFFRVHRSFIVNLSKVDVMEGKTLIIENKMVPIADTYRAPLNKRMQIL